MDPQIKIILISGKQGSGKTTLATELAEIAHRAGGIRAELMNFADPIYKIHNFARFMLVDYGVAPPQSLAVKDGPLLQYLGTEWGRKVYGDDVWVKALKGRIFAFLNRLGLSFKNYLIIVSDCRFRNEFEAFPEAYRVRLECDREVRKARCSQWRENDTHISETDLDDYVNHNAFDQIFNTNEMNSKVIAETIFRAVYTAMYTPELLSVES